MNITAEDLLALADYLDLRGLHTGKELAHNDGTNIRLDICAAAYVVAEETVVPVVFFTDECASLDLIEASDRAMAAIRAISHALDTAPCDTNGGPDYIEHVSNWAATPPIGATQPPTTSEVIGRILRAADSIAHDHTLPPHHHAA
ncbi:hypothetical protein AB0R01_30265 [Streptomyces rochei]|uniref:hypothetical protein n=1 Tax=Streptomyces rochei TaxID=1928 RepID=UPI003414FBFD